MPVRAHVCVCARQKILKEWIRTVRLRPETNKAEDAKTISRYQRFAAANATSPRQQRQ